MIPEDESPRSEGVQYATGKSGGQLLIAPERKKWLGPSGFDRQENTGKINCSFIVTNPQDSYHNFLKIPEL